VVVGVVVSLADLRELTGPADVGLDDRDADAVIDRVLTALTRHRIVTTRALPRPEEAARARLGLPVVRWFTTR
jgi:hypothetical protein